MKFKNKLAALALVGALIGGGVATTAGTGSAEAHDNTASATCSALTVNAVYYETKPGKGEPTLTVNNPDYKPAVPGVPAVGYPTISVEIANPNYVPGKDGVPAVTKTEYLYKQLVTGKTKWMDSLTWNPGLGWYYAGESRTTEVTPAVPAVPAVGTPTTWVDQPNPAYVPAVPEIPAVGEPTKIIDNPEYVAPNAEPNSVKVWIDGVVVEDKFFGTNYSRVFDFGNKYVAHDWKVQITAWNDPTGSKGWTKTRTGTSTPCEIPVVGPKHNANGEATCGAYSITLYNQQGEYESAQTASFVTYIDGKFASTYAVAGGKQQTITGTFPEDSGNHQIIVRTGPAQGDEFVFSLDVTSDCVPPKPEPKVTEGEWSKPVVTCDNTVGDKIDIEREVTTTPWKLVDGQWVPDTENAKIETEKDTYTVTAEDIKALDCAVVVPPTEEPKPTATPTPAPKPVVAENTDGALAATGGDPVVTLWALTGGAMMVALGALSVLLAARRRQLAKQGTTED